MSAPHGGSRSPELYRQLARADQQDVELEREHSALLEILSNLRADERVAIESALSLERQCSALETKLEQDRVYDSRVLEEVAMLESKATRLEVETGRAARQRDALLREIALLEKACEDRRQEVVAARKLMSGAVERALRLDYIVRYRAG